MLNSKYARSLDTLYFHVEGCKVISSFTGNAGFILFLDNQSWAVAYRVDNKISFAFGNGKVPEAYRKKIHSTVFGKATEPTGKNEIYGTERCNIAAELKKSYGKFITGLSIGEDRFNFAFTNDVELDFYLIDDKKHKPAIRVFWEQW